MGVLVEVLSHRADEGSRGEYENPVKKQDFYLMKKSMLKMLALHNIMKVPNILIKQDSNNYEEDV